MYIFLEPDIGINMHTVNKAYSILKSEGYITLDRRHGAFISISKCENEMEKFKEEFLNTLSSCIAKGMSKEEIYNLINESYTDLKGGK